MQSVEGLVVRCREGDEKAWAELIDHFTPLIMSIPLRIGLQQADAEEVFAEVCLRLARSLDGIRAPAALPRWLALAARRVALDVLQKKRPAPVADLPEVADDRTPQDLVATAERGSTKSNHSQMSFLSTGFLTRRGFQVAGVCHASISVSS